MCIVQNKIGCLKSIATAVINSINKASYVHVCATCWFKPHSGSSSFMYMAYVCAPYKWCSSDKNTKENGVKKTQGETWQLDVRHFGKRRTLTETDS